MNRRPLICLCYFLAGLILGGGLLNAQTSNYIPVTILGPDTFTSSTGKLSSQSVPFTVPSMVHAPFIITVINGNAQGQNRVSSARIWINDVQILAPSDFNRSAGGINKTVTLSQSNTLTVDLAGAPGSSLTISIGTADTPTPTATALGNLAASMKVGTWAELLTNNINPTLTDTTGAAGVITIYADKMAWDPNSQQAFFIGSDHDDLQQFVSYSATTNTWQRLPRTSWMPKPTDYNNGMEEGYGHNAIDQAKGIFYFRKYGTFEVHQYNVASQMWDQPPVPNLPFIGDYATCCDAVEFFPEMGGLVWVSGNGNAYFYNSTSGVWSYIARNIALSGTYEYAEYDPVHQVLLFYSAGTGAFYKLSSSGQVTQLRKPPVPFYDGTGAVGTLTVDPVSGKFLFLSPTSRVFYTYDVPTDNWQRLSTPTEPNFKGQVLLATAVNAYGAVLYVGCKPGLPGDCHAYLYKHSSLAADITDPSVPGGLAAVSVSSNQIDLSWTASTDNVAVAGYAILRDGTQLAKTSQRVYSDANLVPGSAYSYTVAAFDAVGNVSPQSVAVSSTTPIN